jgi:hypothetical protein
VVEKFSLLGGSAEEMAELPAGGGVVMVVTVDGSLVGVGVGWWWWLKVAADVWMISCVSGFLRY